MSALTVTITFEEQEARLLGALVHTATRTLSLSESQARIGLGIANKFIAAGQAAIAALIAEHGIEEAERIAQECIDAYPDADGGALAL